MFINDWGCHVTLNERNNKSRGRSVTSKEIIGQYLKIINGFFLQNFLNSTFIIIFSILIQSYIT